jgi:hypothetical protein
MRAVSFCFAPPSNELMRSLTDMHGLQSIVPGERSLDELRCLVRNARKIVADGWQPAFFLIDKSAQERNAILEGELMP